jgi:hypothetical protein
MQSDLFGKVPPQGELFAGESRAKRDFAVNAETVRAKMLAMLAQARAADSMPWPAHRARVFETIFPQMANWLPQEEGDQLLLAFETEMERLRNAA